VPQLHVIERGGGQPAPSVLPYSYASVC